MEIKKIHLKLSKCVKFGRQYILSAIYTFTRETHTYTRFSQANIISPINALNVFLIFFFWCGKIFFNLLPFRSNLFDFLFGSGFSSFQYYLVNGKWTGTIWDALKARGCLDVAKRIWNLYLGWNWISKIVVITLQIWT